MFCAISGESPIHPVVSKTSGFVYERDLIVKALKDNDGKDPVTGDALTEDDLIVIKTVPGAPAVPPRPPTHSSIPALLHTLQNEWDSTMLEVVQLRTQATKLRQELSHALYKEDAAMRVLARVLKERDEAREALSSVQSSLGVPSMPRAAAEDGMDVDDATAAGGPAGGLSGAALHLVNATMESLSSTRRKRKTPPGYATPEEVQQLSQLSTVPSMHASKPPGITSFATAHDGAITLTGGVDKHVIVYDRTHDKQIATLKGHTKKVHAAVFAGPPPTSEGDAALPSFVVSAGADKTVRFWAAGAGKAGTAAYSAVGKPVTGAAEFTGLAVHPAGTIVAAASLDSSVTVFDISGTEPVELRSISIPPASSDSGALASAGITAIAFHPDGGLIGVGCSDGFARVFDVRNTESPTLLPSTAPTGAITSLSFSENGYTLATAAANSVQIWDLRKLTNIKTIETAADTKVNALSWDYSGQYLAAAGSALRVYKHKTWDELLVFEGNVAELTGVAWTQQSRQILVAGMDRTVRILGVAAAA